MNNNVAYLVDNELLRLKSKPGTPIRIDRFNQDGVNAIGVIKKYQLANIGDINKPHISVCYLSNTGEDVINAGGIEKWVSDKQEKEKISLQIGHNISHSHIQSSDLSTNALNRSNPMPSNSETKQSIISKIVIWTVKNMAQIIITVIAGIIVAVISYRLGLNGNCKP